MAFWNRKSRQQPGAAVVSTGMMPTDAGVPMSEDQAMRLATVQACVRVRVLSEDVAALPLHIYRRTKDGGKERATDHPLYHLLHDAPNPEMTAMDFREALMVNALLSGNAYSFIEYDRAARIKALWPLISTDVQKVRTSDGLIEYHVEGRTLLPTEVMHVKGLSYDGLLGLSPIAYARAAMGLAGAAEKFGSLFFGNGTNLGGFITMPGKMSDETFNRLKTQFRENFTGLKNAHGVPILEEGGTYTKLGIAPEDAQFLETRKFQRSEIAAIYRVPPHMIGDLEHATFSNIEHQSIEYLQRTLTPWLVRIEQAMRTSLLLPEERNEYLIEHDTANFLRGDTLSRMQAYQAAVQAGIMTRNECRIRDNLTPLPGGDELLQPLNMQPAGAQSDPDKRDLFPSWDFRFGSERRASGTDKTAALKAMGVTEEQYEALREAFSEWLRAQAADVLRIARRILGERDDSARERLLEALNDYYTDLAKHVPDQLRDAIRPIAEDAFAQVREQVGGEISGLDAGWIEGYMSRYCEQMGKRQANANRRSVERIVRRGGDVLGNLEKKLASWPTATAEQRAMTEAAFARSEAFVAAARKAGYNSVWKSNPACCAACRELDGQVLHGNFRPPLHAGCSCAVSLGERFRTPDDLTGGIKKTIVIDGTEFPFKLNQSKQLEHVAGSKPWKNRVKTSIASGKKPPACFNKGMDPWDIITKYSGKGTVSRLQGTDVVVEYVTIQENGCRTFEKALGRYVRTNRIAIRYSKEKGIHAHPTNERRESN